MFIQLTARFGDCEFVNNMTYLNESELEGVIYYIGLYFNV